MKIQGLKQSTNIEDRRGWKDQSDSKLARDAGINNMARAERRDKWSSRTRSLYMSVYNRTLRDLRNQVNEKVGMPTSDGVKKDRLK